MSISITVLASGRGSNFKAVHIAIQSGQITNASIDALIVDRHNTGAQDYAKINNIRCEVVDYKSSKSRVDFNEKLFELIQKCKPDLILSLGFMKILPISIIDAYLNKIINIHPSLLPAFVGMHAQEQAFKYGAKVSGCTIHFVDKGVDTGPIIAQSAVSIADCKSVDEVQETILIEEHKLIVEVVKNHCKNA